MKTAKFALNNNSERAHFFYCIYRDTVCIIGRNRTIWRLVCKPNVACLFTEFKM